MDAQQAYNRFKKAKDEHNERLKQYVPKGKLELGERNTVLNQNEAESIHYKNYLERVKKKWGLSKSGLELENSPKQVQQTVQEFVQNKEKEAMRGYMLCQGTCEYQQKNLRLWFTVKY